MRTVFVIAAIALSAACDGATRREAESISLAVERFRRADNGAKPAAGEALRAVRCSEADTCVARDVCLAFSEPTAQALRLQAEVAEGLRALDAGTLAKDSPAARLLPEKLERAESLLAEGRTRLEACDDQILALRRRHRL